jgi:hypothetical protein
MSQTELEQRISAALAATDLKAFELVALLDETVDAIVAADTAAEAERERAFDPAQSPDLAKARAAMEDAVFLVNRLRTLQPRLEARLTEVRAIERETQWHADYERVKAKRDALADEFRELYPETVPKLVDLFTRMTAFDAEISHLHTARPAGVSLHLRTPELEARGLESFDRDNPSLATELKLPSWDQPTKLAWPPPKPSAAAAFAASMAMPMHRGGDWWRDGDARAAEQAAESKRVADYYAEQEQLREEREAAR